MRKNNDGSIVGFFPLRITFTIVNVQHNIKSQHAKLISYTYFFVKGKLDFHNIFPCEYSSQ